MPEYICRYNAKSYIVNSDLLNREKIACLCAINSISTESVAPVKHGKWIKTCNVACNWYECSLCHKPIPFGRYKNEYFSNYCPNCGAKMDGGDNV